MILERVSATQKSSWDTCQRYWHFKHIQKLPIPLSPAAQRGISIHKAIEHFLRHGQKLDDEWRTYVDSAEPYLPSVTHGVFIEHYFELPTVPDGPTWIGYIDLLETQREPPRILDYKTTSDFRYAKTSAELEENTQLISYAKWAFDRHLIKSSIEIGHLYLLTSRKTPQVKYVNAFVTPDHVAPVWEREIAAIVDMQFAANVKDTLDLPPNTASCSKYGGCPFRSNCGLIPTEQTWKFSMNTQPPRNPFLERLKAQQNESPVLSPDAASRETPVIPVEDPAIPQHLNESSGKRRGRPPKVRSEESTPSPEPTVLLQQDVLTSAVLPPTPEKSPVLAQPAAQTRGVPRLGLRIYIDCMPVKDRVSEYDPTLFEDYIAPIATSVAEQARVPDYRMIEYGKGKVLLADEIRRRIENAPPVLLINSMAPGAHEALDVLIPYADCVVRALKG